jgi:hypothetical protein
VGRLDDDAAGSGEAFPITPEGRLIAAFLMAAVGWPPEDWPWTGMQA